VPQPRERRGSSTLSPTEIRVLCMWIRLKKKPCSIFSLDAGFSIAAAGATCPSELPELADLAGESEGTDNEDLMRARRRRRPAFGLGFDSVHLQ